MKLCRFLLDVALPRVGLVLDGRTVLDLSGEGVDRLAPLLEGEDAVARLQAWTDRNLPAHSLDRVRLLSPLEQQEVWAAGVTYQRSKKARMEESRFSANAYDRVYEADRPELFFKSLPEKVVAPGAPVGIREDSRWSVPEPELALVLNSRGTVVGYTIGNDVSARDIEGVNLLYLPQAKIYTGSCAVGPVITVGASEAEARVWKITLRIIRDNAPVFTGETNVSQINRSFADLASWLFRCQRFPYGAVLLTGTGIVPPDSLALQVGDRVSIDIDGIGTLENPVVAV